MGKKDQANEKGAPQSSTLQMLQSPQPTYQGTPMSPRPTGCNTPNPLRNLKSSTTTTRPPPGRRTRKAVAANAALAACELWNAWLAVGITATIRTQH
ncbi:hypothetical protein ABVK25_004605 [Lepraria finkii]|uniref:Uncharacterized protein n=1 Tax=Lepraria finkii TaxID=1340010 RepID=A0ABR4BBN6_9LECA